MSPGLSVPRAIGVRDATHKRDKLRVASNAESSTGSPTTDRDGSACWSDGSKDKLIDRRGPEWELHSAIMASVAMAGHNASRVVVLTFEPLNTCSAVRTAHCTQHLGLGQVLERANTCRQEDVSNSVRTVV